MKRFITSLFALCLWTLCLHAQSGEFDPANPGDPQPYYELRVLVSPESGGTVNVAHSVVEAGKQISLRITPATDFKFQQWVCGEEVLSANKNFTYTMPTRNVVITAQMLYDPEIQPFDPASPPDPDPQEPTPVKHLVTVLTSPSVGGTVNKSSFYMQEGKQQSLYAYNNAGYEFVGWYVGDKLESQNNPVTLTMRKSEITITARFRFNPVSPEDPGANLFDPASGILIIDRFTPGRLSDKVSSLVGSGNYSKVTSVTIVGEMNSSDYGIVRNFTNAETMDLSRTVGYTEVPSWSFENLSKLHRLVLPSTVETIGNSAFYGCSGLKELVIYAYAPPTSTQNKASLFYKVGDDLVVSMPAASMPLYQASELWSSFTLLPIDLQALFVSLSDEQVGLYENMFLELLDMQSGQLRRYVITKRNSYSFSGVFDETTYQLTLRNAQNKVFGQEMVTFIGKDTTVMFSSLLRPVDLSVRVVNDKNEDVTAHTAITWTDGEGKYLNKGTALIGQAEGDIVYYQIALDETLGALYQQPDTAIRVLADAEQPIQVISLKPHAMKTISGVVVDSITARPIIGAAVLVTQLVNDKYRKLFNTITNGDGRFELSVVDNERFNIVVSAQNCVKCELANLASTDTIKMAQVSGAQISYAFRFIPATLEGVEAVVQNWYRALENVDIALFNTTTNTPINRFEIQYPRLVLMDPVADGDVIRITVSSRTNDFMPIQVLVTIAEQSAVASLEIKEFGQIHVSFNDSENGITVASLYDAKGKLVKTAEFRNSSIKLTDLADGIYTLVTMGKSDLFNTIYDIKELASANLVAGTDYLMNQLNVESGKISQVNLDKVPELDETKLYYTGNGTSFTVNNSSIVIGNYLTFTGRVDFKPEYASAVSNVQLIVDIPESCSFVENSVMVGNNTSSYTISGNQVIVPVNGASERVRFCATPMVSGSYAPGAYVRFDLGGKTMTQPIGSAFFTAQALSISVPSTVAKKKITISGTAQSKADIEIYDNGTVIGQTVAMVSGKWTAECELANAYDFSKHYIYAKAKTADMELLSETQQCIYDANSNAVKTVTMQYKRNNIVFDMIKGTVTPAVYSYSSPAEYVFIVDFFNNDTNAVSDVMVFAFDSRGKHTKITAEYDETIDRWVAKQYFDNSNAPVNVSVDFVATTSSELDMSIINDAFAETEKLLHEEDSIQTLVNDKFDDLIEKAEAEDLTDEELDAGLDYIFNLYGIHWNDNTLKPEDQAIIDHIKTLEGEQREQEIANELGKRNHEPSEEYKAAERQYYEPIHETYPATPNSPEIRVDMNKPIINDQTNQVNLKDWNFSPPNSSDVRIYIPDGGGEIKVDLSDRLTMPNTKQEYKDWAQKAELLTSQKIAYGNSGVGITAQAFELLCDKGIQQCQDDIAFTRQLMKLAKTGPNPVKNGADYLKEMERIAQQRSRYTKAKTGLGAIGKATAGLGAFMGGWSIGSDIRNGLGISDEWDELMKDIEDCADERAEELAAKAKEHQDWINGRYAMKGTADAAATGLGIAGAALAGASGGASFALNIAAFAGSIAANHWENEFNKTNKKNWNSIISQLNELDCHPQDYPRPINPKTQPVRISWDPAGFVYEGVEENRVEGVQATVYYKDTHENIFGEMVEEEVMWDASEFDQENPLYTDENGFYQWFVPQGLWQVRFEKEGYEPTQSEWLPVPPPQLEVNIPIVQLRQPEVLNAIARNDAVDIVFDKYMQPELLNTDNILVTANGQKVEGSVTLLDEQVSYSGESTTFASKARFVPATAFTAHEITLTVSNRVRSYADVPMSQTFQQTFDIEGVGAMEQTQAPEPSVPDGSVVLLGAELSLACATEGAVIRYTLDGSTPDCLHGLVYNGVPLGLYGDKSVIISAIACADGFEPSEVVQWTYTFGKNPTAVEETESDSLRIEKLLRNGQLFIVRDGKMYNVLGIEVK